MNGKIFTALSVLFFLNGSISCMDGETPSGESAQSIGLALNRTFDQDGILLEGATLLFGEVPQSRKKRSELDDLKEGAYWHNKYYKLDDKENQKNKIN